MNTIRPHIIIDDAPADQHTLSVFNAVDVPRDVQDAVMRLLAPFDADVYERACDAEGRTR